MRRNLATYGDPGFSLFLRKAFIKAAGFSDDALDRPIIGITNTFSDFNPCHGNVPRLIEAVKRGVMLAGGLPMEFPTISIHESFANPTSMFLRNLMAIDTEEMIRAQPCDSVVLIGGCDKTVPAQLMGAVSADIPAIQLITGPMLVGHHKGEILGACTDCRRLWGQHRAGQIDAAEIEVLSGRLAPTQGTCMVMGTASTMGCLVEALGIALPGSGTIPATHADRIRAAEASGREAVRLAKGGPKPSEILTETAFRNALTVLQAIGGSTNGLVHLAAIARRAGLSIDLAEFDAIGRKVPVLIDLKPSGDHYMEHFHWAGGVPKLMKELGDHLDRSAPTIDGRTIGEVADAAEDVPNQSIIRTAACPVKPTGGMAVLRGNLAPGGAVIKHSAASPALLKHTGRAVVFASVEDMVRRMDDPDLDVKADDVLVLTNAGPKGAPGMPEAGYIPIPKKLAQAGVKDMVRISDARMSGTAFGTIVLHITPESAVGGPLGLVRDGDMIRLDVEAREIALLVDDAERERRKSEWRPPAHLAEESRGYRHLYLTTVLQADEGCDFDFC
ncbi:IlvD/Edd family dehydratase [Bosea sp. RAF48]|uniref:IlvD/Edd family dehydratase n=1 Tax=Bosea sp. RAF48 TaxID=3237480 RepID=UPI003F90A7C6